jgi:hypothetical protein
MFPLYVTVTIVAAAATGYAVLMDARRPDWLLSNMARLGIPQSQLAALGGIKALGALGLLVGVAVPVIGAAAAIGLVLFFVGAIARVLDRRYYAHLPYPITYLLLAAASLLLRVAAW